MTLEIETKDGKSLPSWSILKRVKKDGCHGGGGGLVSSVVNRERQIRVSSSTRVEGVRVGNQSNLERE